MRSTVMSVRAATPQGRLAARSRLNGRLGGEGGRAGESSGRRRRQELRRKRICVCAAAAPETTALPFSLTSDSRVGEIISEFQSVSDERERYRLILKYASTLPTFPEEHRVLENRVMGCTSKVWLLAELDNVGHIQFLATSDSQLTQGLCAILLKILSGLTPEEVLEFDPEVLQHLRLGPAIMVQSRTNGVLNLLESMRKRTRMLMKQFPSFPSLIISADSLTPKGAFAEAQAEYLEPEKDTVLDLAAHLREKKIGIVAHFYMDPEVQGVLAAASEIWPHIHISDSLVMADRAVSMAEAGCKYIAVLGVDFMSENVRAILNKAGHGDVKVYRMATSNIGCSLAEAAESSLYMSYLSEAKQVRDSLHVVYINTSLRTKALAHMKVPTITCTSSNVVQTILQAFAQIPGVNVWYGPDTYMGRNVVELFQSLLQFSDAQIQELHPAHNRSTIRSVIPRLKYFKDGLCIVHHMFGGEVCQLVKEAYGDAYLTAHFEVPGEMFSLAMEAKKRGMGVVGSTSSILNFIDSVVEDELSHERSGKLQFILGTESGMITSIVRSVQKLLRDKGNSQLQVEIVFPVSTEAIVTQEQKTSSGTAVDLPGDLQVLPGPATGEGCSSAGGCANCPYMKMNTLDALRYVIGRIGNPIGEALLEEYEPKAYEDCVGPGISVADVGCEPIVHMRTFQSTGEFSQDLVQDVLSRNEV